MTRTLGRMLLVVGLVALLAALVGCQQTPTQGGGTPEPSASPPPAPTTGESEAPAAAKEAPDFSLTTLDGKKISLSDLKGKPVMVVFWASWCHYCAQEAPSIEALYQQYHPKGLEVLGVGTDDAASLAKKANELKLTYPIGSNPDAGKAYGVTSIPHVFVIAKDGAISASLLGARPKDELEGEIKKVM